MAYDIKNFWSSVIRPSGGWVVGALADADYFLRDALALLLVQRCLAGREDVRMRFERAFAGQGAPGASSGNVLLLARPRAYFGSCLDDAAQALSSRTLGKFLDDRGGGTGDAIRYGNYVFRRIDFETTSGESRRTREDYAVLQILRELTRDGGGRYVVGIVGVSAFGTLCLALILATPERRAALVEQIEDCMAESLRGADEEYFECCVRVSVEDEAALANLANEPAFGFQVKVVASGTSLRVRPDEIELRLRPPAGDADGAVFVRSEGDPISLTDSRYQLLRLLVERSPRTRTDLVETLRFPCGTDAERERANGRLARMVHDLNQTLTSLPRLQGARPIISKREDDELSYLLHGVRARVEY